MKKTILIVDDSKDIAELTQRLLENRGFSVVSITEGNRTLAVSKEKKPDLILLDMLLEDKTGLEICHELKTDPVTKNIPVILATGNVQPAETGTKFIAPDSYLIKPFEIEELLGQINKFTTAS